MKKMKNVAYLTSDSADAIMRDRSPLVLGRHYRWLHSHVVTDLDCRQFLHCWHQHRDPDVNETDSDKTDWLYAINKQLMSVANAAVQREHNNPPLLQLWFVNLPWTRFETNQIQQENLWSNWLTQVYVQTAVRVCTSHNHYNFTSQLLKAVTDNALVKAVRD